MSSMQSLPSSSASSTGKKTARTEAQRRHALETDEWTASVEPHEATSQGTTLSSRKPYVYSHPNSNLEWKTISPTPAQEAAAPPRTRQYSWLTSDASTFQSSNIKAAPIAPLTPIPLPALPHIPAAKHAVLPLVAYQTLELLLTDLNRLLCTPHVDRPFEFRGTCAIVGAHAVSAAAAEHEARVRLVAWEAIERTVFTFDVNNLTVHSGARAAFATTQTSAIWMAARSGSGLERGDAAVSLCALRAPPHHWGRHRRARACPRAEYCGGAEAFFDGTR
ncbi:hypothetical protein B0H13DRAFT_2301653 [Mycena leptocephala]|nr:hypothetical protein B0H13DRAFT_2301653 [Mycena leptocephala]